MQCSAVLCSAVHSVRWCVQGVQCAVECAVECAIYLQFAMFARHKVYLLIVIHVAVWTQGQYSYLPEYCTAVQGSAVQCTARHFSAVHGTALHCTALHCTALHNTALQHCTAMFKLDIGRIVCQAPVSLITNCSSAASQKKKSKAMDSCSKFV